MMGVFIMELKMLLFEMVNVFLFMFLIVSLFFLVWKNGNLKGNVLIFLFCYFFLCILLFNIVIEDKIY